MNVEPTSATAFLLFAISVSLSPGPNNLLIAASGNSLGFVRSIPAILGISVGFLLLLLLVSSGAAAFITDNDGLGLALKLAGSAYLLYLAWKLASSKGALVIPTTGAMDCSPTPASDTGSAPTVGKSTAATEPTQPATAQRGWRVGFRHMMLLQFANPKGWAMALSAIVTFRPSFPSGWTGFVLLCALFTLVNLASNSVWALLGQGIGSVLDRPRRVRAFNIGAAVLLAVSVVTIFF